MGLKLNPFTGQLDIVGSGGGGGGGTASRYESSFNNTTDWGSPSGGYYTITITAAAHGKGLSPVSFLYEASGADYLEVNVDEVKINDPSPEVIRFSIIDSGFSFM